VPAAGGAFAIAIRDDIGLTLWARMTSLIGTPDERRPPVADEAHGPTHVWDGGRERRSMAGPSHG